MIHLPSQPPLPVLPFLLTGQSIMWLLEAFPTAHLLLGDGPPEIWAIVISRAQAEHPLTAVDADIS